MKFQGSFTGSIHLVFPKTDASKLVSLLAEDERSEREMDAIRSDTLQEIGNVLLNAVMGTISNLFSFSLRYSLPLYIEGSPEDLYRSLKIGRPNIIIRALTRFTIDNMAVDGSLIFLFALRSFDALMSKVAIYSGTG
jgi:chemotaxis protein CheC